VRKRPTAVVNVIAAVRQATLRPNVWRPPIVPCVRTWAVQRDTDWGQRRAFRRPAKRDGLKGGKGKTRNKKSPSPLPPKKDKKKAREAEAKKKAKLKPGSQPPSQIGKKREGNMGEKKKTLTPPKLVEQKLQGEASLEEAMETD